VAAWDGCHTAADWPTSAKFFGLRGVLAEVNKDLFRWRLPSPSSLQWPITDSDMAEWGESIASLLRTHTSALTSHCQDYPTVAGGPATDNRKATVSREDLDAAAKNCIQVAVKRIVRERDGASYQPGGELVDPEDEERQRSRQAFKAELSNMSKMEVAVEVRHRLDLLNEPIKAEGGRWKTYTKGLQVSKQDMMKFLLKHGPRTDEEKNVRAREPRFLLSSHTQRLARALQVDEHDLFYVMPSGCLTFEALWPDVEELVTALGWTADSAHAGFCFCFCFRPILLFRCFVAVWNANTWPDALQFGLKGVLEDVNRDVFMWLEADIYNKGGDDRLPWRM
jgi:hypothetical protein